MALLQGFEEINMSMPTGKSTMTVTDSVVRFNKATAADLGYPAYVKILINDKTRQIALQVCTAKNGNAVKFSKPEGKQTTSVNIKDAVVLEALHKYFTLPEAPRVRSPTSPCPVSCMSRRRPSSLMRMRRRPAP